MAAIFAIDAARMVSLIIVLGYDATIHNQFNRMNACLLCGIPKRRVENGGIAVYRDLNFALVYELTCSCNARDFAQLFCRISRSLLTAHFLDDEKCPTRLMKRIDDTNQKG